MSRATKDHFHIRALGQNATLYRRTDIGNSSWYLRVFLKDERRYYRESMRTPDREEAKTKAEFTIHEILSKVKTGERVLAISVRELLRRFKLQQEQDVRTDDLRKATLALQTHHINICMEFLNDTLEAGLDTRLSAVDGSVFEGYLAWRQERREEDGKKPIGKDVVRQELHIASKMFKFGVAFKQCTEKAIPEWSFTVNKSATRARVTGDERRAFMSHLEAWPYKAKNLRELYNRELMRHVFMTMTQSGMRTGECLQLRHSDVELRQKSNLCVVTIRAETSKRKQERTITVGSLLQGPVQANYLFKWILMHPPTQSSDFVFCLDGDGGKSAMRMCARTFNEFSKSLKNVHLDHLDLYHARHIWVTNRVRAGENIFDIAKVAGTSVSQIEATYYQVQTELASEKMLESQVPFDE